jgi:hypothetical protein
MDEGGEFDLNDSGHWSSKIPGFKTLRDPEKQRRKTERRKMKEVQNHYCHICHSRSTWGPKISG